jgi:GNAT superfamily N-acetyltransferase
MLVRRAVPADAATLAAVGATSLADVEAQAAHVVLIAEDEDVVLGYAMLDRNFFGRPFLRSLFVRAEYRRQGVGKMLLSAVLESQAERTLPRPTCQMARCTRR